MAAHPAFRFSRPWLLVLLVGIVTGCGPASDPIEVSRGSDRTYRIVVNGTTILVPGPAGMRDSLVFSAQAAAQKPKEDVTVVYFMSGDSVGTAGLGGNGMVNVPHENSRSAARTRWAYSFLADRDRTVARKVATPESERLVEDLRQWRAGIRINSQLPRPERYPFFVLVTERTPNMLQIVTVGRSTTIVDFRVLVRGRLLNLVLFPEAATVGGLDDACVAAERWANAVVAANP